MRMRLIIIFAVAIMLIVAGVMVATPSLRQKSESKACGNYMLAIGFAAQLWAEEHDAHLPSDLLSMSRLVVMPKFFICPGDHTRHAAASWDVFTSADSSYTIVTPGLLRGDTKSVFLRCTLHDNLGYADGTVFVNGRPHHK